MPVRIPHPLKQLHILFTYGRAIRRQAKPIEVRPFEAPAPLIISDSSPIEIIRSTYPKGLIETYQDAIIKNHHPLAFDSRGAAITTSASQSISNFRADNNFKIKPKTARPHKKLKKALLLDNWYGHYGHWYFEQFPKLFEASIPRETCIIVNRGSPCSLKIEALKRAGFNNIHIYTGQQVNVENLMIISGEGMNSNSTTLALREHILDTYGGKKSSYPPRIYISRQNSTRRCSNFHQILPILKHHQIQVINPLDLSLSEQMEMYVNARIMIGIQGSGMRNAIFMKQGQAIELHGTFREYGQQALIEATPVNYTALQHHDNSNKNDGIKVDPSALKLCLSQILTPQHPI